MCSTSKMINLMRRNFLLISITCTLMLGGWGSLLASALCPHTRGSVTASVVGEVKDAASAVMDADHACCRAMKIAKIAQTDARNDVGGHCSGVGSQANLNFGQQSATAHHNVSHNEVQLFGAANAALFNRNTVEDFCTHCVGRAPQPTSSVFTRASRESRRDSDASPPAREQQFASSTAKAVLSLIPAPQESPPAPAARRHLIIGIFLI